MKRLTGTSAPLAIVPHGLTAYPVSDWPELMNRIRWLIRSAFLDKVLPGRLDEYTDDATQAAAAWILEHCQNPGGLSVTDLARRAARQGVRAHQRHLSAWQRDKTLTPAPGSTLPEPNPEPLQTRLAELQAIRWAARQHRQHWQELTAAWTAAARPVRRHRIERGQIGWRSDHNRRPVDQTWIAISGPQEDIQVCRTLKRQFVRRSGFCGHVPRTGLIGYVQSDQTVTAGERHYDNAGPVIDRGHVVTGIGNGVANRPNANALPSALQTIVSYRWLPGVNVFPQVQWYAPHDREERARYVAWLRVFAR